MIQILKSCFSLTAILLVLVIARPLSSSAQVQYTDLIPDEVIQLSVPWPTQCNSDQYELDINLDNTVDFIVHARCDGGYYPDTAIISIQSAGSSGYFVIDGSGYVDTLNYYGDTIAPWLKWAASERVLLKRSFYPSIYFGNWIQEKEHFVGIKVLEGSSTFFGWIRMVVTNGSAKATIKDFGINSVPGMPVMAGQGLEDFALNIRVADVGDLKNGEDMNVAFDRAYNETGIVEYRIMVVNAEQAGSFTVDSANAVTADHYTSVPADGTSHSLQLDSLATSTNGRLITNGIDYSVFILSCYENKSKNVLSYPVSIVLRTQAQAVTDVFCRDNGNAGDGSDVLVAFPKVSNEDSISEYRIMVVPAQQVETFDLEAADQVGQGYYTAVIPVDSNIVVSLNPQSTDINGDPIFEETGYYIFILSVADGVLADKNALSIPSNVVILSTPSYLYAGQLDKPCIHYVDIEPDIELSSREQASYKLDLNGDGAEDYSFGCYYGGSVGYGAMGSGIEGSHQNKKIITSLNSTWIKRFDFGDPLTFFDGMKSESCILYRYTWSDLGPCVWSGYWAGARDKYAGLILFDGNDTIMGWVKMDVYSPDHIVIKEYAWMVYCHQTVADFNYVKDEYEVCFAHTSKMADTLIWNFGDGTSSTEANPVHTYSQEGDFLVTLIASGPFGTDTAIQLINICEMPTASFWFDLSNWGELILYNESLKADAYYWNFGDGNVSNEETPEYTYTKNGTYQLSLITARGSCTDTLKADVTVCIYPKADFYYEELDSTVHFHSTNLNSDSLYWDFGDGFGSFLTDPVHTFNQSQQFQVTLHAWNACGHDSITKMVLSLEEFLSDPFIYPNPARDRLYIRSPFPFKKTSVHLYDPSGQLISLQHSLKQDNKTTILDISGIGEGLYMLEIFLDNRIVRKKIIVMR